MTGNKGEWSEFYVFIKLLSDKKIYAADQSLGKLEELFFPIISIIREEPQSILEYRISNEGTITVLSAEGKELCSIESDGLSQKVKTIFDAIKSGTETFSIPFAEEIMDSFRVTKLKAGNNKKEDITLKIHDLNTCTDQTAGFSIKSMIGSPATLLNSSAATNFKYQINNCRDGILDETNKIDSRSKIRDRLLFLTENDCTLDFVDIPSEVFSENLKIVDTILPLILSEYLLAYYFGYGSRISDISSYVLKNSETLSEYKLTEVAYTHKIKTFLHAIALGMVPGTLWDGEIRAHGGYIIVREDGELVCYHVFNADQFREYLYQNVKFDTPSSTKHGFGSVYKEGDNYYIDLNIQVRFIQ